MRVEGTGSIGPGDTPAGAEGDAQVRDLAGQFEALLLTKMLGELRRSMLSGEEADGFGTDGLTDAMDAQLGLALSRAGGFGLAQSLVGSLRNEAGQAARAESSPATKIEP